MENAETLHHEIISLFLQPDEVYAELKNYPRAQLLNLNLKSAKHVLDYDSQAPTSFTINPRAEDPYTEFFDYLKKTDKRVLIIAESAGRRESLAGLLKQHSTGYKVVDSWTEFANSDTPLALSVAEIDRGMNLPNDNIEVITESQLYGERTFQRRKRSDKNRDPDAIIKSLAELNIGDPVVHEDHGVGRYRGLETLNVAGDDNEYAILEYKDGDKIYIPVLSLDKVSRYVGGGPETAPLHKMGSDSWVKLRKKANKTSTRWSCIPCSRSYL